MLLMYFQGKWISVTVQVNQAIEDLDQCSQEHKKIMNTVDRGMHRALKADISWVCLPVCVHVGASHWEHIPQSLVTWERAWLWQVSPWILAYTRKEIAVKIYLSRAEFWTSNGCSWLEEQKDLPWLQPYPRGLICHSSKTTHWRNTLFDSLFSH